MKEVVLSFEQLQDVTGYTRPADVERCLKEQGIAFFRGRRGPWTIVKSLEVAMGLAGGERAGESIRF